MLAIYDFVNAFFAESVAAFCDVWVVESLKADDAFSVLAHYVVNADFDCLIILGVAFLEAGRRIYGKHGLVNNVYHRFINTCTNCNY